MKPEGRGHPFARSRSGRAWPAQGHLNHDIKTVQQQDRGSWGGARVVVAPHVRFSLSLNTLPLKRRRANKAKRGTPSLIHTHTITM
jgi:hypothetical protein